MKPDKAGIWEWFDNDGTKRLVTVVNVEHDASRPPFLRVYWWGGYYSVNDERHPNVSEEDWIAKTEWPDRWGNYVGPNDSAKEDLYLMPTEEQLEKIKNAYENQSK